MAYNMVAIMLVAKLHTNMKKGNHLMNYTKIDFDQLNKKIINSSYIRTAKSVCLLADRQ